MKYLLTVLALTLVISCKDKSPEVVDPVPSPTPVVVEPTPVPPTPVPVDKSHCSPEGNKFYAGNPVWYGFPKCHADSDGEMHFKDLQAIKDLFASGKMSLCLFVVLKDGTQIRVEQPNVVPGPCATAKEL